jgi:dUTP pyrophosphatase
MKLNQIVTYATKGSAGFDIVADETVVIKQRHTAKIKTTLRIVSAEQGEYVSILPRSSLSSKGILAVDGTIDGDYEGLWSVVILNTTGDIYKIHAGDRIAQGILRSFNYIEGAHVADRIRGQGAFGSTDQVKQEK